MALNPATPELFVGESIDTDTYHVLLEASHVGLRRAGAIAETYSRDGSPSAAVTLTNSETNYTAINLQAGDVVSKITVFVIGTATTPTHAVLGLYDVNFNQLAVCADTLTTAWTANSEFQVTLTTPYTVLADGVFYIAVGTTSSGAPTLAGLVGSAALNTLSPAVAFLDTTTVTTSLPTPATKSAGASAFYAWVE